MSVLKLDWSAGGARAALVILAAVSLSAGGCAKSASDKPPATGASRPVKLFGGDPFPAATPRAVTRVTDEIFPAVVRIDVAQAVYSDGKRSLKRGLGSGVIIDDQGHILTNYHVAGRAVELFVTLYNKERVPAKLIGDDHWTDLAIIQLDMDVVRQRGITFSYARLGDSNSLQIGQPVMAIGTPFGLTRTTTLGVVSNTERTFYPQVQRIDEYETGLFSNWIQMDTPIAPGNSGGPLVDLSGRLVGINTRGFQGQALNFAIPINTANAVAQEILASAKPGKRGMVTRADLGVDLKPLQDLETFYEIDINRGVLINSVERGSPAEKAGVRVQDILLAINGDPVNVRFPEEVAPARKRITDLPIGKPVTLTLKRGQQTLELTAVPDRLEGSVGEERGFRAWGFSARDVTRAYANDKRLDDDKGIVLTTLASGLPAAKAELKSDDVIREVNGTPVNNMQEFAAAYLVSVVKREPRVLITYQRGRGQYRAVLNVTYENTTSPTTQSGEELAE